MHHGRLLGAMLSTLEQLAATDHDVELLTLACPATQMMLSTNWAAWWQCMAKMQLLQMP